MNAHEFIFYHVGQMKSFFERFTIFPKSLTHFVVEATVGKKIWRLPDLWLLKVHRLQKALPGSVSIIKLCVTTIETPRQKNVHNPMV